MIVGTGCALPTGGGVVERTGFGLWTGIFHREVIAAVVELRLGEGALASHVDGDFDGDSRERSSPKFYS